MVFRTELKPLKHSWSIDHHSPIFTIGSCFADCMGLQFEKNLFQTHANPVGILYNPISIIYNLVNSINECQVDRKQILKRQDFYFHYQFHSQIFDVDKDRLEEKIKAKYQVVRAALKNSEFLIITLGTSFVYGLKDKDITVANCHKMPSEIFFKRMLTVSEITQTLEEGISQLTSFNPKLKIILTISPVRHIKDSLELNAVSKSILRASCFEITQEHKEKVYYFPSYELMMDDLRDYRFYKDDLIHPNRQAEEYIWSKFSDTFFDTKTKEYLREIGDINSALQHKPIHPHTEEYRSFLKKLEEKVEKLNKKIPVESLLEKVALKLEL